MKATDMFYGEGKVFPNSEQKTFAREELIYNVTEDFLVALEELDISKKELASRLGKTRAHVTQLLSGARNMTLGSLSDICFVLGLKPSINIDSRSYIEVLDMKDGAKWKGGSKAVPNARKPSIKIICDHGVIVSNEGSRWAPTEMAA